MQKESRGGLGTRPCRYKDEDGQVVNRTKREGKNDAYSHLSSMQKGPFGGFFDRKSKNPPRVLEEG
jgi:hypothetical protein